MPEVPTPVRRLLDASNAGDHTRFLDSFTADGAVDDWGRVFRGRTAIGEWSAAEFIGKQVTVAPTSVTDTGEGTVVIGQVGGNGFNGPSTFTFRVDGDQVSLMTIRE
ncbi:nuclear transport factor 2 family protein [Williamsia sp.]|uniref:nuclear transport factor 2 family protein n=1 Tax=Williamsia sp. TaxID=1872085 RepID=UPI002F91E3FE